MRRAAAALAGLLLTACSVPTGEPVPGCEGDWRLLEPYIVTPDAPSEGAEPIPIECMQRIDERRVRIGFVMPPGPTCHRLSQIEVVEAADAVSVTLLLAPVEDPLAGPCPDEEQRVITEVDLAAPVGERMLLDGSG